MGLTRVVTGHGITLVQPIQTTDGQTIGEIYPARYVIDCALT